MTAVSGPGARRGGGQKSSVAVFSMPEAGHFQRLRPIISGLAERGLDVHVLTHRKFEAQIVRAGGIFFDLFTRYPVEAADDESLPVPSRFVTFAAKYGEDIRRDLEKIRPSLIIHDTFALIGQIAATGLGLPRVNVCAGHNVAPARYLEAMPRDPRVKTSSRCLEAVRVLKEKYGLEDASPFSYLSATSPDLNVYCEPPEFLEGEKRAPFEPIAFYGSLPSLKEMGEPEADAAGSFGGAAGGALRVYVCFGTIIWRYYADQAVRSLTTLAAAFAGRKDIRAVISLGREGLERGLVSSLSRPNVKVLESVDQWAILREADVFFTHHGLSSTHEAIFHRVPMISHPFFWDQPELAELCRDLGLAIPLIDHPGDDFDAGRVESVFARLDTEREAIGNALARAREWEIAVIAGRPAVLDRIMKLRG